MIVATASFQALTHSVEDFPARLLPSACACLEVTHLPWWNRCHFPHSDDPTPLFRILQVSCPFGTRQWLQVVAMLIRGITASPCLLLECYDRGLSSHQSITVLDICTDVHSEWVFPLRNGTFTNACAIRPNFQCLSYWSRTSKGTEAIRVRDVVYYGLQFAFPMLVMK